MELNNENIKHQLIWSDENDEHMNMKAKRA